MTRSLLCALACLPLLGCHNALPAGNPGTGSQWASLDVNVHQKVDMLFMVDNSPSMTPKQNQLKTQFPLLIRQMQQLASAGMPVDYHIGVVTSDMGAGPTIIGGGQCHPGGDGGRLQPLGAAAAQGCQAPTGGFNFINYDQRQLDANGQPLSNLPTNQDLATTFTCMASVGDNGCGFEAQLESVYAALHNPPPENQGFLRDDALLMVVFLSDEDDCSAPPDTDLFNQGMAEYGPLNSYRCSRYGIVCGGPAALLPEGPSNGPLLDCTSAPNPNGMGPGKLYDIGRYTDFFDKSASQGGIKSDPGDVLLVDITAPAMPVETLYADVSTPPPWQSCGAPSDTCQPALQHSCIAPADNSFFGDPAVRIRQVVAGSQWNRLSSSICDTSYSSAMESMSQLLGSHVAGAGCVPPLADPTHPQCQVEDVTAAGSSSTTTELPACSSGQKPCWRIAADAACPTRLVIDRDGQIPPNTSVQARCMVSTTT